MSEPKSISAYDTMLVTDALRAAIEHLEAMQQENDKLRRENAMLRLNPRQFVKAGLEQWR